VGTIVKTTSRFAAVAKVLPAAAEEAAVRSARRGARDGAKRAPKRSGALAASGYLKQSDGSSTYDQAVAAAREKNPTVQIADEVSAPPPGQVAVAFAAGHADTVHDGGKKMKARPFLQQAVDDEEAGFLAELSQLEQRIRERL
jgi:hypothetical protein